MSEEVYYTTVRPGYVVQEFKEENLFKYDETYVKKYDAYSTDQSNALQVMRLSALEGYIHNKDKPLKLLDVGYGRGDFLELCTLVNEQALRDKSIGKPFFDLYGYDVVDTLVPKGVQKVEDIKGEYDVVTFFDSLEHVPVHNIIPYLKGIKTKCFMISIPWYHHNTADREWFKTWRHRRPNEHLHFFDSFGLMSIMEDIGFKIIHISNIEDHIRKPDGNLPNILTIVAVKND